MGSLSPEIRTMYPGEVRLVSIDCRGYLDSGVLLTGTPTLSISSTVPTTTAIVVNTTALTINNSTVSVGQAIQFVFSSTEAGALYTVRATVTSNTTPAGTFKPAVRIQMETT